MGTDRVAVHGEFVREKFGICQWFHYQDDGQVDRAVDLLADLKVKHLRTGISWADYLRPCGPAWYDRLFSRLSEAGLELLVSVWHTPPSHSVDGTCSAPPRRLKDYADFIDTVISRYGGMFSAIELWNEPNNRYKWNFAAHDPQWRRFAEMIGMAGYWARQSGMTTVLGGIIPVDPAWLRLMHSYDLLSVIDVVAIHAFPDMWWENHPNWDWYHAWNGWRAKIDSIAREAQDRPIWVTETGLATWELENGRPGRTEMQELRLREAVQAPVPRIYWYSLIDLDPEREAIEGFHVDENEYHMGLVTHDGRRKPAYFALREILREAEERPAEPKENRREPERG